MRSRIEQLGNKLEHQAKLDPDLVVYWEDLQDLLKASHKAKFLPNRTILVGNLPDSVMDTELKELFSQAGTVKSSLILGDAQSRRSYGLAFVQMSLAVEVQQAITLFNGRDYQGRMLKVKSVLASVNRY
jgi:RNA recognition motif-containing protein